jgi:hypothetical protein
VTRRDHAENGSIFLSATSKAAVIVDLCLGSFLSALQTGVADAVMLFMSQLLVHGGRLVLAVPMAFPALRRLYLLFRSDRWQAVCRTLRGLRAGGAADINWVARRKCLLHGLV